MTTKQDNVIEPKLDREVNLGFIAPFTELKTKQYVNGDDRYFIFDTDENKEYEINDNLFHKLLSEMREKNRKTKEHGDKLDKLINLVDDISKLINEEKIMTTKDKKPVPFINEISCDEEVYKKGSVFEILDIPKEKANEYCIKLSKEDKRHKYDWHYFGGRVVVKRLEREFLRQEEKQTATIKVKGAEIYIVAITGILSMRAAGDFLGSYIASMAFRSRLPIETDGYYTINLIQVEDYPYSFKLIDFNPLKNKVFWSLLI